LCWEVFPLPRHRLFIATLALAAGVGTYVVVSGSTPQAQYTAGIAFLVALTVVGVFDVWLPRGDYTEMGAPLVVAGVLLLSPPVALIAASLSRVLVWGSRRFSENPWRVLEDIARRLALMSMTAIAFARIDGPQALAAGRGSEALVRVLAVAITYLLLDMAVTQLSSSLRLGVPYIPLLLGNVRLRGWMGTAQISAAVLAVLTYNTMGLLGLAIVVGLLLVTRQSFSLLMDIRLAYRSTVEALARAIEAHDPTRRGHAERVAALSTDAARLLGQHGKRLEALTYAALFHDVGKLDSDEERGEKTGSAEVLENVGFLAASVPILRIIDSKGDIESSQDEVDLVSAYVVARMCEFDDTLNGIPVAQDHAAAEDIGARLYARTRREVDRAVRRVELRSKSGGMRSTHAELEESW
jgi:hypothetical protein